MQLLVKRDGTKLQKVAGKSFVDSDAPSFLHAPHAVYPNLVRSMEERLEEDDLLVADESDFESMNHSLDSNGGLFYFNYYSAGNPPPFRLLKRIGLTFKGFLEEKEKRESELSAVWSGYRSVLVKDPRTEKLYKLKGVSLDVDNPEITDIGDDAFRINGGQFLDCAEYEREMSDRFNETLMNEGIEPVMQVKGMWKYPNLVKRFRPVASIAEVQGDTRLDELMWVLENLYIDNLDYRMKRKGSRDFELVCGEPTSDGLKISHCLDKLYTEMGFVTGRLKSLMDRSGQTWSYDDMSNTNAHIGNIVVYNGTDKLKLGFVDFDTSQTRKTVSRSVMRETHEIEQKTLMNSVKMLPISMREIDGLPSKVFQEHKSIDMSFREMFIDGFMVGYEYDSSEYSNEIDLGNLQEVFALLRLGGMFSQAPPEERAYSGEFAIQPDIDPKGIYGGKKLTSGLDDIIKKVDEYDKDIIRNDKYFFNNGFGIYGNDRDEDPYVIYGSNKDKGSYLKDYLSYEPSK